MIPVKWGRILTAMVTPFNESLQVDYSMAEELAKFLVDNGSDGLVVNGTTGESPTTTPEEKLRLLECVMNAVGDRATVIAGTGSNSTTASINLTQAATEIGVHGIMLVTPYYNKPPQQGLIDHFRWIADSTSLPVMIYNVPGRTGTNLLPSSVEELSKTQNIVALKEASGNLDQVTDILSRVPENFLVYSGDDSLTLPILSLGGHGIVSVASHIVGPTMKQMVEMYLAGEISSAAKLHRELFPIFKGLFAVTNPIPVKTALNLMGHNVGPNRPPLSQMTDIELETLKTTLEKTGLI
jgi:4-hydroxy-tetrahydrodipicolinate synthase